MIDIREPIFGWGQLVRAANDLVNDGSHPEFPPEALLAPAGSVGEIVNIGRHADSNTPVYLVEFTLAARGGSAGGLIVIGCLEHELASE